MPISVHEINVDEIRTQYKRKGKIVFFISPEKSIGHHIAQMIRSIAADESCHSNSIQSLQEFNVIISDEVRLYLAQSFVGSYPVTSNNDDNDDDDTNNDSFTNVGSDNHSKQQLKAVATNNQRHRIAMEYVDRVLMCMKTSPGITVCRINTIQKQFTKEEIRTKLQSYIENEWLMNRYQYLPHHDGTIMCSVEDHPILHDVLCIKVVLNDCNKSTTSVYTQRVPANEGQNDRIVNSDTKDIEFATKENIEERPSSNTNSINNATINATATLWLLQQQREQQREQSGWPSTHRVVICDRFCGEAVLRGSDIYVKGILVADTGIRSNEIVAVYADVGTKKQIHGHNCINSNAATNKIDKSNTCPGFSNNISRGMTLEQYKGRSCIYLGLGRTVCKRSQFFNTATGLGIEMVPQSHQNCTVQLPLHNNFILPPLSGIFSNVLFLQNEPSIVVGATLQPFQHNFRVLDMCCAPGGKTFHLACLTNHLHNVTIVACDKSRKKVLAVKEFFLQQGVTNIVPLALDTTRCVIYPEMNEQQQQKQKQKQSCDGKTTTKIIPTTCNKSKSVDQVAYQ